MYSHRGLLIDVAKRLPDILGREGFIIVHNETRAWAWAGADGLEQRDNLASVMRGPIFKADVFGLISSEREYDDLLHGLAITNEAYLLRKTGQHCMLKRCAVPMKVKDQGILTIFAQVSV
ncbi:hypothetical protein ARMGADRAFT_1090404 [Armillaria gallica]|uniref:Uncharacterized protein n=1 Tax=Armillaria gallica TaxID=47427 RepID=A0A2H3CH07_ARMGA|nr:hypothetical protein ARMGADRAFT_1090404 [Armillaria gallica]